MNSLVYVIANNVNDKLYVGKTEVGFEKRWSRHQTAAKYPRPRDHYHFNNAVRKHGADQFYCAAQMQVSEECAQRLGVPIGDMLKDLEVALIARLETWKGDKGYNSTMGGDGVRATAEVREKISVANRRRWEGKTLTPEERRRMARYGNTSHLGHKHTEETRARLSEITKEAMSDSDVRARLSAVAEERMKDPEMRRLASEGARLQMSDPETRVRLTASLRAVSPEERRRRFGLATQARQTASSIRKRRFSQLLNEGKSIKDIASELGISIGYARQVRTILRGSPCVTE